MGVATGPQGVYAVSSSIVAYSLSGSSPQVFQSAAAPNASRDDVLQAPLAGGPSTVLASSAEEESIVQIAVDANRLYWLTTNQDATGKMMSVPLSGDVPSTLVQAQDGSPSGLAIDFS